MKTAVLIPCYNEAITIGKVIDDFRKFLPEADIYVYDNNSTDKTLEIARSKPGVITGIVSEQEKANVILRMFEEIEADAYIMIDGDDTYPVDTIQKMLDYFNNEKCEMLVGDRLSNIGENLVYRNGVYYHNGNCRSYSLLF